MTKDPGAREAAYRDLVGGLIDARVDLTSQRFDSELAEAEAAGRIDPATARVLRWWQRESLRAVTEHTRNTLPGAIVALERSAQEAQEALAQSEAAWYAGRAAAARSATSEVPDDAASPPTTTQAAPPSPAPPPPGRAPAPPPAASFAPPQPGEQSAAVPAPTAFAPSTPSLPDHLTRAAPVDLPPPPATPAEHAGQQRRRTLVAGLTVLPPD